MTSQQTQAEHNKAIVRRYRETHNQNNLAALDAIVAADLIAHNLLPGVPPGLEGGKLVHSGVVALFPDIQTATDDLIAEGDKVVERWTMRGTHTGGEFLGVAPSGKSFTMTGISIYRIANGKIVEHWANQDDLGLQQQLGVIPPPNQVSS
jgi:predicted ester cyclase